MDFAPLVGVEDSRDLTDLTQDSSRAPSLYEELTQSLSEAASSGQRLEPIGLDFSAQSSYSQRSVPGQESLYGSRPSSSSSASTASRESVQTVRPLPSDSVVTISTEPDGESDTSLIQNLSQHRTSQHSNLSNNNSTSDHSSNQHHSSGSRSIVSDQHQSSDSSRLSQAHNSTANSLQLSQHSVAEASDSGTGSLLQQSNRSTQEYISGRLSNFDSRRSSFDVVCEARLSEYPIPEPDLNITSRKSLLTQYPFEDTFQKSGDVRSGSSTGHSGLTSEKELSSKAFNTMASGESSDPMAMFMTRAGTAIEAEAGPDVKRSKLDDELAPEASLAASIKREHMHHESELGETLLHDEMDPILSSTPFTNTVSSILASGIFEDPMPRVNLKYAPQDDASATSPTKASSSSGAARVISPFVFEKFESSSKSASGTASGTEASGMNPSDLPEEYAETSEVYYPQDSLIMDPSFTCVEKDDNDDNRSEASSYKSGSSVEVGGSLHPLDLDRLSGSPGSNRDRLSGSQSPSSPLTARMASQFTTDLAAGDDGKSVNSDSRHHLLAPSPTHPAAGDEISSKPEETSFGSHLLGQFEVNKGPDAASAQDSSSFAAADKSSFTVVTDLDQQSATGMSEENMSNLSIPSDAASLEQRVQKLLQDDAKQTQNLTTEMRHSNKSLSSVDAKSDGSLSDRVAAILAGVPPETVGGSEGSLPRRKSTEVAEDSEQEEIDRIAGEYRAVLRDRVANSISDSESNTSASKHSAVEIVTATKPDGKTEYISATVKSASRDTDSETDDTLDNDVRKILSKYGRSLSDSEDEKGGRRSRKQSGDSESEGMVSRVNSLLYGRPSNNTKDTMASTDSHLLATSGTIASYLYDDPSKSMSLPMDLVGIGASQETVSKIDAARARDDARKGKSEDEQSNNNNNSVQSSQLPLLSDRKLPDYSSGGLQKSDFTDGVLVSVDDTSKHSSQTSSLAGSVDLDNLTKDLDEMEADLESWKDGGRRSGSEASHRSGHSHTSSKGFASGVLVPEYDPSDMQSLPSVEGGKLPTEYESSEQSSYYKTEGMSRSKYSSDLSKKPDLGAHALLTSNVIPLEVALDIVHGYDDPLSRSRLRSSEFDRSGINSSYNSRKYDLTADRSDIEQELLKYRGAPMTDRISGSRSYPEKVADIVRRNSPTRQAYEYLSEAEKEQKRVKSPEDHRLSSSQRRTPMQSFNISGLSSSTTPISSKPFSALGNFKSLYSSHVDKVSMEQFDKSVELRTPYRRHLEENLHQRTDPSDAHRDRKSRESPAFSLYGSDSPVDHGTRNQQRLGSYDYYGNLRGATESVSELLLSSAGASDNARYRSSLGPGADRPPIPQSSSSSLSSGGGTRPLVERHTPHSSKQRRSVEPSDTLNKDYSQTPSSTELKYSQGYSSSSRDAKDSRSVEPKDSSYASHSAEPKNSTYASRSAEHKDASISAGPKTTTRSTSPGAGFEQAGLRPYRPVGSQEMYYVESGQEDGSTVTMAMSESTVESTHLGSDDAKAPKFPSSALGSRQESSSSSEGIYHKPQDKGLLSTIQEQASVDSRDTESAKSKSDSERSRKEEEKERSVRKAQSWVEVIGDDGTPRDPHEKGTPRDADDAEGVSPEKLQEEIQPQHAIDAKLLRDIDAKLKKHKEFGTPQKSTQRATSSLHGKYHSPAAANSSGFLGQFTGTPALRIGSSDESISPVLPLGRGISSGLYDPVTSSVDYGRLRYLQGDDSYSISGPALGASQTTSHGASRNVSFSPLRVDQDTDELLEFNPEDVPGKAYPSTPHPVTGKLSLEPVSHPGISLDSTFSEESAPGGLDPRIPQKYHFKDGSVIYRSNPTEQPSVLSDQLRYDDKSAMKSSSYTVPDAKSTLPARISSTDTELYRADALRDLSSGVLSPESRYDEARLHERMRYIIDRLSPSRDPVELLNQLRAASGSLEHGRGNRSEEDEAINRVILQELARQEEELATKSGEVSRKDFSRHHDPSFEQRERKVSPDFEMHVGPRRSNEWDLTTTNTSQVSKGVQVELKKSQTQEQATSYTPREEAETGIPRLQLPFDSASDSEGSQISSRQADRKDQPDQRNAIYEQHQRLLQQRVAEERRSDQGRNVSDSRKVGEKANTSVRFSVERHRSPSIEQPRSQQRDQHPPPQPQDISSAPLTRQELDASNLSKNTSQASADSNATGSKKTAYLIKDETLASVPEDETLESISSDFTISSYESADGRVIMKTTKRHLPDDPKLLRLQHKILKQKEKYKHDRLRELKRKEKIAKLERVLAERNIVLRGRGTPEAERGQKVTSTPASKRHQSRTVAEDSLGSISSDSATLTMSDISNSSTLTGSSIVSEDNSSIAKIQKGQWQILDESHKCTCKAASAARQSTSPSRKQKEDAHHRTTNENLPTKVVHKSSGASYMEFDKPASFTLKQKRPSKSRSPARSKGDPGKENVNVSKQPRTMRRDGSKPLDVTRTPQSTKQDFGQTCPTPMCVSPVHELIKADSSTVTMVSQAVQTHQQLPARTEDSGFEHSTKENRPEPDRRVLVERHRHSDPKQQSFQRADTRDVSLSKESLRSRLRRDQMSEKDKTSFSAGQCGLSWFVPMTESRPWRRPLRERQSIANSLSTWSTHDRSLSSHLRGLQEELARVHRAEEGKHRPVGQHSKKSLQSAFERHMQRFVSASRERQRVVSLRAEERRIQDLHDTERERLFAVQKKMQANLYAVPISELHYNPQKRKFSRKQMVEQSRRKYEELPEVKHQKAEKKKQESYKTNRLRAQLYKNKIQNHVLHKRSAVFT